MHCSRFFSSLAIVACCAAAVLAKPVAEKRGNVGHSSSVTTIPSATTAPSTFTSTTSKPTSTLTTTTLDPIGGLVDSLVSDVTGLVSNIDGAVSTQGATVSSVLSLCNQLISDLWSTNVAIAALGSAKASTNLNLSNLVAQIVSIVKCCLTVVSLDIVNTLSSLSAIVGTIDNALCALLNTVAIAVPGVLTLVTTTLMNSGVTGATFSNAGLVTCASLLY